MSNDRRTKVQASCETACPENRHGVVAWILNSELNRIYTIQPLFISSAKSIGTVRIVQMERGRDEMLGV